MVDDNARESFLFIYADTEAQRKSRSGCVLPKTANVLIAYTLDVIISAKPGKKGVLHIGDGKTKKKKKKRRMFTVT